MSKKGKLHTLNKYEADRINKAAFMPREDKNIFNGLLTPSNSLSTPNFNSYNFGNYNFGNYKPFASSDIFKQYGASTTGSVKSGEIPSNNSWLYDNWKARQNKISNPYNIVKPLDDYTATNAQRIGVGLSPKSDSSDLNFNINTADTDGDADTGKSSFGNTMAQIGGVAAQVAPREAYDVLDPVYHLAGGRESTVGNTFSNAGVGLFKAGAQSGNGWLMLAGAGAKVFGGLWNGAFGIKENKANVDFIKNNTAQARRAGQLFGNVSDNSDLLDRASQLTTNSRFGWRDLYKNGWWTSKGTRKGNALINKENSAIAYQNNAFVKAANEVDRSNDDRVQSTFITAYGGPLHLATDDNYYTGPTEWSLAYDNMLTKRMKEENNNNMPINNFNYFGESDSDNVFANGGKIHINPKNKGKFNATKKRTGKTTEELTHSKNPLTRKRAIFAQNARKWKHADGGPLNVFENGGPRWTTSVGSVGPGGFVPNNLRGTYGGGIGLGGGAGTRISDVPEYETTVQNDTIWLPVTRNFNQAWREAVKQGKDTLHFNGGAYPIEYSNNPGWKEAGDAREEIVDLLPLITEKKKTERKKAEGGPLNILCGGGKFFDLGGDMQTNGADFPTGLTHIDAGLSHELNPNEGVQVGVDSEGTPNLVEEGEAIWNDYVFSNRIKLDNTTKEVFHINKKRDITYADLAKKLEKEIKERPNDPISKAAFNAQMERLTEEQERQKADMEAKRAKEAFEALSPEEQVAVMQQAAAQEQAAQDVAMQQQAMAQQQAMQSQVSPEEAQMMQQQQMMQAEPLMGQQPAMEAYGGRINRFDDGGFTNWWDNYIAHSSNLKNIDWNRLYESITGTPASEGLSVNADSDIRSAVRSALKDYYETNPAVFRPYSATNYSWIQPSNGATSFYDFSNITPVNVSRTQEDPMARFIGKSQRQIFAELAKSDFDSSDAELQRKASEIYEQLQKADRVQAANKWLTDNHPEYSDDVRNKLTEMMASSRSAVGSSGRFKPELAFKGLVPTYNFSDSNYANYVKKLVDNGISFDDAFNIARTFSPDKDSDISERSRRQLRNRIREKANITEAAAQPVQAAQSASNTSQGVASNRAYLDFPDIPDTGYVGGSNTQYENAVNSATDFDTARTSFLESVSPQKIDTVRNALNNLSDEEKQQFLSLDTPEKQAKFINDIYSNKNQKSDNAVSVESTEQKQQTPPKAQSTQGPVQGATAGSSTYRNVGELKEDPQTSWRNFVLPGLNKYIDDWEDRINNAATQEERNGLIDQMVTEFNGLQQSYNDNVWPNVGKSGYYYDPKVESHQRDWSRMYGNTGFFVAQPDGTTVDAVGQAVNKAGSMGDNPEDGGIDGYNGPNTSLRNYGATMYGDADFYKPIIDRFRNLGVDYKLSDTLKNGNDALYVLSRRASQAPAQMTEATPEGLRGILGEASRTPGIPTTIGDKAPAATTPAGNGAPVTTEPEEKYIYKPKLANETNFGLFGPIAGLTMQAMGIGKPDYSGLDKAQAIADRAPALASYQPIGDYVRYSPFDIWATQNRLDADNRATQRSISNQASPTRGAESIALAYAENLGAGQVKRQAEESNLAQKLQTSEFNRGTNIQNANAFNQLSQFNAGQLNHNNQFRSQIALRNAMQRMDADAGWYNSLYGNVNALFKGIGDYEREVRDRNTIAKMVASGIYPGVNPDNAVYAGLVERFPVSAAEGGKVKRKKNKKRGLTI